MFYEKIDNLLIANCQRLVWHIERSIFLERSRVAKLLVILNYFFAFIVFVLALVVINNNPIPLLFSLVLFYGHLSVKGAISQEIGQGYTPGTRPKAIKERASRRGVITYYTFVLPFAFLFAINKMLERAHEYDSLFSVFFILIAILLPSALILFFNEFFLCTTSLPPGERKQRHQKNIRNTALVEAS